ILSAIQPARFSMRYPPPWWPQVISLVPFQQLFNEYPVVSWVTNSSIISLLSTLLCLALAIFGAYTLSCLRWRGRDAFGILLFFTQMLPEALIIIPIFIILRQLQLLENLPSVSLVNAAFVLPIGIWILKGVFDAVPREIREAALVDGCDELSVLWRIVVPLSLPGLVAVGVVAFFYAWNEFLFTSTMLTTDAVRPASVGLAWFTEASNGDPREHVLVEAGTVWVRLHGPPASVEELTRLNRVHADAVVGPLDRQLAC